MRVKNTIIIDYGRRKMTETILETKQIYPTSEFVSGAWNEEINVRDFIQNNYTFFDIFRRNIHE